MLLKQKKGIFKLVGVSTSLALLFVIFQNFSPATPRTLSPYKMPTVIVNHDLFSYYFPSLDGREKQIKPFGLSSEVAATRIANNQKEVTGAGAAFSLNLTYGSHVIPYW